MPIPLWIKVVATAFGLLFFAGYLLLAVVGVRSAPTRDRRMEAIGAVIPGVAGLLLVVAFLAPWPLLSFSSAAVAVPVMLLGRAVYEDLIAFRPRGPGPPHEE